MAKPREYVDFLPMELLFSNIAILTDVQKKKDERADRSEHKDAKETFLISTEATTRLKTRGARAFQRIKFLHVYM